MENLEKTIQTPEESYWIPKCRYRTLKIDICHIYRLWLQHEISPDYIFVNAFKIAEIVEAAAKEADVFNADTILKGFLDGFSYVTFTFYYGLRMSRAEYKEMVKRFYYIMNKKLTDYNEEMMKQMTKNRVKKDLTLQRSSGEVK